ncbi:MULTISPECIES: YnbE family lipoprotein [unclassified Marinobacter]|uniref:YnbE family lipoprotein n=1 Tax=unclassified Marinobacter TaxID=83889 RepID=UPI00200C732A|nr:MULTISPECIES: YnbE family lipoprotein [unclassified Marinobacter]UQG57339.1 YnbE family lipoprotein [Marinobacter sp. M4C]UQG66143.1 YnbE family lipoprotein [Marinobacter sp. M2C]UQG70423.1 YnbE family lipoprotein [Marinobacter sp. M1C]
MTYVGLNVFRPLTALLAGLLLATVVSGCTPTVRVQAPKEPITVNLNVKIQHEIYVKVDKDVDELFSEKGLF